MAQVAGGLLWDFQDFHFSQAVDSDHRVTNGTYSLDISLVIILFSCSKL